ncbi:calcium/sodium antiporter [Fibrobacter succinogenes]|uniref:Cation:H+ antiporter n=1 Tax=Fibrobacter succinogenes TaxID=833 RepID=A0A380RWY4_FIBSU|nr:calcium/sodium antiporter [Fibrobacter succinogenes]PWJ37145.1 cation:H+ antiporter [Fibrobacter succinogenes subsp. elongatus]SUQ19392.1 cation:H+ antiporter [Fibrobacter succinogenes]
MILAIVAIVVGLVLLVWSADRFVDGAVGVAQFFGMSTFLIGMLVVGFGTSAPEMVVSVLSALNDTPQLALGNAYGSNIANIALILGTTALIAPVIVKKQAVKRDIPILIATTVLTIVLVKDGNVSLFDGVVLLLAFVAITVFNISMELRDKRKRKNEAAESEPAEKVSIVKAFAWLLVGLALLIASSRMLVWGAVYMAQALGVSDLLIGLTIVAVGTSLPELASSIAAARRGENDLAVGNVIGSNIFNTLVVVGIAAVITPIKAMDAEVLSRDLPIMSALTLLLFFICIPFKKKNGKRVSGFGRIGGAFFLSLYIAYLVLLGIQSV